eukprot:scaffold32964_cov33-Tisochrysis_lutea.AAC.3
MRAVRALWLLLLSWPLLAGTFCLRQCHVSLMSVTPSSWVGLVAGRPLGVSVGSLQRGRRLYIHELQAFLSACFMLHAL